MADTFPTREELTASQLVQLRQLFSRVVASNRFYQEKLSGLKIDEALASLETFSAKVPFTTKSDIVTDQEGHPPYGTNLTFPLQDYTRFHQTSGTTGAPLRWLDTPESWQWMVENWKTVFKAANVGREDRVLFTFSFGPFLGFWLAFEAAQQLGCLCLPAGGLSSEARLKLLFDNEATVLCCTPTYAIRLAEVATSMGLDTRKAKVKSLLVAGEPGGSIAGTRARLEALWPTARVSDHHGMTEVGPVTFECPRRPGVLHVMESGYVAEIIDPASRQPVSPGETGELVLTTLGRFGSPLIRYRTGDLVKRTKEPDCACGRHEMALKGGILGRADDMVIVRGVNIYPTAVEDVLRQFPAVIEYKVIFRADEALAGLEILVELENSGAGASDVLRTIERALQLAFNLRVPVKVVAANTLPRFEMKAKRWVRM